MRVSESFTQLQFLRQLTRVKGSLDEALARVSTGLAVRTASDNPAAAAELLRIDDEVEKINRRAGGIDQSRMWLQQTEEAITVVGREMVNARNLALSALNGPIGPDGPAQLAEQARGLLEAVRSMTTLKVGSAYIFSGTLTNVPPYDASGTYQGNSAITEIPLDDVRAQLNVPGIDIFGEETGTGPLALLSSLVTALENGDTATLRTLADGLNTAITDNSGRLARIGTARKALEDGADRLSNQMFSLKARRGDLASANMVEAISDTQKYDTSYQATLAAGARLYGPNFFDYLG